MSETGENLNAIFDSSIADICSRIESKVIDFEKVVGERTRIEICEGFSSPLCGIDARFSIAIQNKGAKLFGAAATDLAIEIARDLAILLQELGARKTISGHID